MPTQLKPTEHFKRATSVFLVLIISISLICDLAVYATSDSLKYYIGDGKDTRVNTGKDNGYSGSDEIGLNDPHYGWQLGRFSVSGYTRVSEDADRNPVFIKTLGDTVALWFNLEQDIENLNGNNKLTINEDKDGYDKYFETEKTNFGHGTLIIRHTDWQNKAGDPAIYTDYLVSIEELNADTKVQLFEEGDYEVALNYEIRKKDNFLLFDAYTNYRIFFKFAVRNGNCMVYPFDIKTKEEMLNSSITENGFYLDLARSRYLDIDVRKEVLSASADGLVADTRFNRPAADGEEYTEEGIYTITVSNRYTNEKTTKRIYVGTNNVLRAYMTTGLPIKEITEMLSHGAQIHNDGSIVFPPSNIEIAITDTNNNPLAGAVFSVINASGTNIGNVYTTGIDGKAVVPSLVPGSYMISMIEAPSNYILNEQPRTIDVTSDKVATVTFSVVEFPSLSICVVDSVTGEFVAGNKFTVADSDNAIISELQSLSTGAITMEHIRPGTYTISGTHDANDDAMGDDVIIVVEVRTNGSIYCNGMVLDNNTLTFQSINAPSKEESESTLPEPTSSDDDTAQIVVIEPEVKSDLNLSSWGAAIAAVIVLTIVTIILLRRRSLKSTAEELRSDETDNINSDAEGNDK